MPGLSEVHPEVREAIAKPIFPHRGHEMEELLRRVDIGLRDLFRTERHVLIGTCTATAFMEMAVRAGVRRRALCLVAGTYGERFAGVAESVGKDVVRLNVPLGRTIEPNMLEDALHRSNVDAVTLVHSETSTGALAPLEDLAATVREFDDVTLLVDGVTSVGACPVETDLWGLDCVFAGSYGALALPPGLALAVASERMCDQARLVSERGAVLDLLAFQEAAEAHQPTYTPAISLLLGLEQQLLRLEECGGVETRWQTHDSMLAAVEDWVDSEGRELGFRFLPEFGRRSPAVSCLRVPDGENGRDLAKALAAEQGYAIGSGYGKLKVETIRIGHMGDHTVEELKGLLEALSGVVIGRQPE